MQQTDKQRIFLIGPMGAGKSSIGKALALITSKPFIDVDEEIVRVTGKSIPQIFETEGESGFRSIETRILKKLCSYEAVIATGGGIVVTEENLMILSDNGLVIYLYADVDTQYKRTMHDTNRPMILVDDRHKRLSDIFSIREPIYNKVCDFVIDSSKHSIHECVEEIKAKLKELSWKI